MISINAIKDSPITVTVAAPQIERYLVNQKYKQATDAEIARLRSLATIEYLNAQTSVSDVEKPITQSTMIIMPDSANNLTLPGPSSEGLIERGIMGLK